MSAAETIWKRSVPVSETGPYRTATKIGDALFPGWPLRISHFVTLRLSKEPITVCESADADFSRQENVSTSWCFDDPQWIDRHSLDSFCEMNTNMRYSDGQNKREGKATTNVPFIGPSFSFLKFRGVITAWY